MKHGKCTYRHVGGDKIALVENKYQMLVCSFFFDVFFYRSTSGA